MNNHIPNDLGNYISPSERRRRRLESQENARVNKASSDVFVLLAACLSSTRKTQIETKALKTPENYEQVFSRLPASPAEAFPQVTSREPKRRHRLRDK